MDALGSRPADAFAGLTYAGEEVVEAVSVSGGTLGVTTHRVLALTPGGDGPNFSAVDRPNVESIALGSAGTAAHGVRAARFAVYGVALLGASVLVNFDSMSAIDPPATAGAGQVVTLAVRMTNLLSHVDDALRVAGVVVLVVALGFLALYGASRDRHVAVTVAGGDPVRVPVRKGEVVDLARLTVTLEKASNPSDG